MIKSIDQNSNKSKQKSILDYFNRNGQKKRTSDEIEFVDLSDHKCHKTDTNYKSDVKTESDCQTNALKSRDCNVDVTKEEFIDLTKFLEIDINVEDKEVLLLDDHNITSNESPTDDSHVYHTFRQMIDFVLEDNQLSNMFDETDKNVIQAFTCLSGMSQMLFVRLFLRKRSWIRKKTMKYEIILGNLDSVLDELLMNKFVLDVSELSDINEALEILDGIEIKKVGRSLNGLNMSGLNTKKNIINGIIKYLNTSQSVLKSLDNKSRSVTEFLLKSIRSILKNKCFKLNQEFCDVFERMFLLYCEPDLSEEEVNSQMNFEFFKILKVTSGKEVYPKYTVNRSASIYKSRQNLLDYCEAFKLEIEILSAIDKKNFDVIEQLMSSAKQKYYDIIRDQKDQMDLFLPEFLRRFTAGHTYIRCLSHCVSVLEQKRQYSEAVDLLKNVLLRQRIYRQDSRGRWYERLALNMNKHWKDPKSALQVIEEALKDESVRTGHRLALYLRQKNIQKLLKLKVSPLDEYENIKYSETTIYAETIKYSINDRKNIFKVTDSSTGDVTVMPVEDIVIKNYINNGFTAGIHTESRAYHSILGLLFWDIIYTDKVCDAFRFGFQRLPLDFNSDSFFNQRKTQIISLLNTLKEMRETEISNVLENCWNNNCGTISLVNWEAIDIKHLKEIVECFGTSIIIDICDRLIRDFRHTRSGFPDLIVWDYSSKKIKVVEVKGPNDRPSTKQKLWLNFMQSIGCDVEICHVKVKKSFVSCDS